MSRDNKTLDELVSNMFSTYLAFVKEIKRNISLGEEYENLTKVLKNLDDFKRKKANGKTRGAATFDF
jgi:hypothetical protein